MSRQVQSTPDYEVPTLTKPPTRFDKHNSMIGEGSSHAINHNDSLNLKIEKPVVSSPE